MITKKKEIWTQSEARYFLREGWTSSISLNGNGKFDFWRKGGGRTILSPQSFRGDAKHRTRNLEILGLVLGAKSPLILSPSHHPGMTPCDFRIAWPLPG